MDFFVSQVVTISPCVTNTQYALSLINASLSFSHFPLSFPSFTHFSLSLSLVLFRTQSLSLSHLPSAFVFFLLFILMRGLKSSNKVCLLKNSSYSALSTSSPPRPFFSFFFRQFISLALSISHSHSLVIVMYQNKLNILFTSSLNSVKIFHTFR